MSSWFSNLHVRKNNNITETTIAEYIRGLMIAKECLPVSSAEEADGAFAIITDEKSRWYSVYSDLFFFDRPQLFTDYAQPMSVELETEILGISCFDSDYLYLNLIDATKELDAWAGVGSAAGLGIQRRTKVSAWKNNVSDFERFKESFRKKYVYAEELLAEVEECIHLPREYGVACYEYLAESGFSDRAILMYFKLSETAKTEEPPKLVQIMSSHMPFFIGEPHIVKGTNVGGTSRGISVYFLGPYVENEEITFSEVSFIEWKNYQAVEIPFELKKIRLSDGQWAYYYHDPGYKILPKVDERIPMFKRMRIQIEQSVTVHFVPQGDPKKILDITVVLVPDKNVQGQTACNVWHKFGSKREYIQHHNNIWKDNIYGQHLLLNEDDYL